MPRTTTLTTALAGLLASTTATADLAVGSWNIQHLGWDNGKDLAAVAAVASRFDLLAVQELMDPAALGRLERRFEERTGEAWGSMASDALGASSYQEHYGFLWREAEATYVEGAVVYLDRRGAFARPPYSALFADTDTGQRYAAATVHITYGDSVSDRTPEIRALDEYWRWLDETYSDSTRLLMGDFNLELGNEAWRELDALAKPAVTRDGTTLSSTDGRYASLYDNIWYDSSRLRPDGSGVLRFPELLDINHEEARDSVSDHAPVHLLLDGAQLRDAAAATGRRDGRRERRQPAARSGCVNINRASADALEEIIHVGPARAEDIIQGRPWESADELDRIDGIGPSRLEDIEEQGEACVP
ncbi:helix-hairpin-helix domain-containing protein [Halorhodospira neutriphila]|uniref:Endonuclease/exonuclease/phosphatase domain-containing protein n=1 Tax=Halorhodospira neutriphila TaxID=168379 RepID=A0ABS1E689_9GAMM|nr:helix-hairpin-helix domain-containing protein [Halorhodospira neutriphila]MBK1726722.1 hypothetical protein [Halorhodospira neutriphila]